MSHTRWSLAPRASFTKCQERYVIQGVAHARGSTCKPYQYEPYVIAERKQLPSYDERFRGAQVMCHTVQGPGLQEPSLFPSTGYNYNKLSYFYYLHMLGFRFFVHPWAYVVHMPHEEQHRRKEQMQHSNDKYQMVRVFKRCPGWRHTLVVCRWRTYLCGSFLIACAKGSTSRCLLSSHLHLGSAWSTSCPPTPNNKFSTTF